MQRQILAALLRSNAGRGQEAERRVIKMRTWKMAGIAALAGAMTIGASQAQQPQSIKLVYDVHFGGLKIGKAEISGAFGEQEYRATTRIETSGVADAFFTATVDGESHGVRDEAGALTPLRFIADTKTSERDQLVEIVFADGAPSIAQAVPAYKKKSYEIEPEKQIGAIDPLSAALQALAPAPAEQVCNTRLDVFDGRKRWALDFSNPRRDENIIECDGVYERIAGFKPKHMRRQTKFPFDVTYRVGDDGLAVVERILIKTDYGSGVAKLRASSPQS